jgi:hypothetical protein
MNVVNKDEYGRAICLWFDQRFPNVVTIKDTDLLDILTNLLISTKENRYGSIPSPELLVEIRKTISKSIEIGHPIPILIPWGGRKPRVNNSVDITELSAINQLMMLNECIKKYFSPGLMINIRIEDLGADWLYRYDVNSPELVDRYSSDFVTLVNLFQDKPFIKPIRESLLMDSQTYFQKSEIISALLQSMITTQIAYPKINIEEVKSYKDLKEMGWKGTIPVEQREYYFNRYKTLYPNQGDERYIKMIADYFAGSKVRYDLNGTASPITPVELVIKISFVAPIPGAPVSMFNNTLYWRTVPASQGRTHIAPWRAKGFFKIGANVSDVVAKITSFNDPIVADLIPSTTILQNGTTELEISTDYLLID